MFQSLRHLFGFRDDTFKPYSEVKSISDAYDVAVKNVINKHIEVKTEDGEVTWQSDPFTICITQPWRSNFMHKNSPYGKEFYKQYAKDVVEGNTSEFVYNYHTRLFNHKVNYYNDIIDLFVPTEVYKPVLDEKINQIQYCIDKLIEEPTTRRAIALTWVPKLDTVRKDVPCLQLTQFWISEEKLNGSFTFRSNDMLSASGMNMVGLYALQRYVARNIDYKIGKMYYTAIIPHCYPERDFSELKKWL